uniref:DUF551 domain-containing protein n=1 Tax=uncultured Acidovorax sp. TaxID=158751 RepID=UPI00082F6984|nr:DUF551 domain-containing protein [uncultured Acidovorax sp.]
MEWIKLTDRMPNPDEHGRVLIYTEGYDFNGEQVFDVKAETLNECFYADPEDQPEVCRHASHWTAHPRNAALHPTGQQGDLLTLLADIKRFDIQNLSLDLPQDIRARIERALIGWGDLTAEQKAADALRSLMDALPVGTQTAMTVFRPEVNGQQAGAVKTFLMAENSDDLRAAQWVIAHGSAKRGGGDE